ncbi:MAG: DUF3567 family protein [Rhodocyclaceae bacterium]|nr:DUF3567 family protein [Rhodocyclaceae bacterium]
MNVVYNSEHFSILAYPAQQGFELVDKEGSRTLFIQGEVAYRFREAIDAIPEGERDEETIDGFIEEYCDGFARPIRFH